MLQAQGGGYDNDLTQQQLAHYEPQVQYPISGTQISRKWEYDNAFNLTATNDRAWGRTEYQSNKNGQVTAVFSGLSEEFFRYDAQQNLTYKARNDTLTNENWQIKQRHGRIVRFGNKTYKYDEFGRLKTKTETKQGFRPVTTYYKWNSQSQLVEIQSPHKGVWRYEYDAFSRRGNKYQIPGEDQPHPNQIINMPIRPNRDYWHKINELWDEQENFAKNPQKMTACKGTKFLYHHNQLVAEIPLHTDGNAALAEDWDEAVYWLYQNDDFTPTARLHKGELHYTISDQIGTITELMSEKGYIHYRQKLNLWGEAKTETLHHQRASNDEIICNHRFVGQYYDEESGLHYNRFRYYSPETAQYLQSDPIGLLGGFNPYGYVFDPTGWVDPLGLNTCPSSNKPQVRTNYENGKAAERQVANKIRNQKIDGLEYVGEQVYVKTPEGGRYIDVLARDMNTGNYVAIEVKSGNAQRTASQVRKDTIIDSGGGIFTGKRATELGIANQSTAGVTSREVLVPLSELRK